MKKNVFLLLLCTLMMTSCLVPRKMVYMKDMRPEILYTIASQRPEMKIQQNDRLKITVSSRRPELTAPFNMGVGGYQIGSDGEVRTTVNSSRQQESGFVVDRQGRIEFPELGMIPVEGMTKQEVSNMIQDRLRERQLVSDALVTVDILNFKITMMGEVNGIGVQSIQDERITLLDAIIRAGGVTTNASMGQVVVIREEKRGYRFMMNDLRTVAVFDSPSFYLQQNDIVYVLPKSARTTEREARSWQWYSTAMGLVGTVMSLMLLLNYYK